MIKNIELKFVRKLSAEDIKHAISPKLADMRAENNYTLEEISYFTGLSPAKIRSMENGVQYHTWSQYQRLLKFYNLNIKFMIILEDASKN